MSTSEETVRESSSENSEPELRYQDREEYIRELETWVNEARMWQHISSNFPYFLFLNNSLNVGTSENNPPNDAQNNLRNINDTPQRPNQSNQYRLPEGMCGVIILYLFEYSEIVRSSCDFTLLLSYLVHV